MNRRCSGSCFLRGLGGCGGPEKERRHFGIHGGEKAGQTEKELEEYDRKRREEKVLRNQVQQKRDGGEG